MTTLGAEPRHPIEEPSESTPTPPALPRRWWASPWTVVALGAASVQIYLWGFTSRWPLGQLYDQPFLDYAWLSRYTREGQALYLGAFLAAFALHYAAYLVLRSAPGAGPLWLVVGGQAVLGALMVAIYPVAALDVYDYLMYGRIVLLYGGNPFTQPPSTFPDPLVGYSPWPNEASVYGPIWQVVSLVPTALAGSSLLVGLVAFKVTALLFSIACSLVIWRLLRLLDPRHAPAGTLLFAWNPLLLFELAGNSHNDAAMLLPILLAILAMIRGPRILVFPLLAVAMLTKLPAIALGPAFLYGLLRVNADWRDKVFWIVGGGGLALLVVVVAYAPFWEGTRTLYFLSRGNWFTASFPTLLREYLRRFIDFEDAGRLAATLVAIAFGLYVLARIIALWWIDRVPALLPETARERSEWHRWLAAAHDLTFVYLAFACLWWEPWYLTWLVGLAALLPNRLLHDRALLFCYGGVVNYVVFKYVWPVYQPMTYTQIMGLAVVAIFGLPLLHLACSAGVRLGRGSWERPLEQVAQASRSRW